MDTIVLEQAKHPLNEMLPSSGLIKLKGAIETTWGSKACFTNLLELFNGFGAKRLSGR